MLKIVPSAPLRSIFCMKTPARTHKRLRRAYSIQLYLLTSVSRVVRRCSFFAALRSAMRLTGCSVQSTPNGAQTISGAQPTA